MAGRNGSQIRVLVLDVSHMGTQLLCEVLGRERGLAPVTSRSLDEITTDNVDIALIADTAQLESFQGSGLIQELRRRRPDLPVIVLVEEPSRSAVVDAVRSGARGVLCRTEPITALGKCVSCVHDGQVWANQQALEYLIQALSDPIPIRLVNAKGASLLSAREQDVVRWVAEGMTNREIADRLELSEHTIKNYLFRIFEKLGISNRMELMLYVVSQLAPRLAASMEHNGFHDDGGPGQSRQFDPTGPLPAFALAERYRRGDGIAADEICAYMWFEVARSASAEIMNKAGSALVELKRSMKPEQVAEGKRRATERIARARGSGRGSDRDVDGSLERPSKIA